MMIIIIIIRVVVMKVTTTVMIMIRENLHSLPQEGCGVKADMLREDSEIKILKLLHSNKFSEECG